MQAALSASQAAQFLNISERRFHQLRHDPAFPKARAVGTRNRWVTEELLAYLQRRCHPPKNWPSLFNFANQENVEILSPSRRHGRRPRRAKYD